MEVAPAALGTGFPEYDEAKQREIADRTAKAKAAAFQRRQAELAALQKKAERKQARTGAPAPVPTTHKHDNLHPPALDILAAAFDLSGIPPITMPSVQMNPESILDASHLEEYLKQDLYGDETRRKRAERKRRHPGQPSIRNLVFAQYVEAERAAADRLNAHALSATASAAPVEIQPPLQARPAHVARPSHAPQTTGQTLAFNQVVEDELTAVERLNAVAPAAPAKFQPPRQARPAQEARPSHTPRVAGYSGQTNDMDVSKQYRAYLPTVTTRYNPIIARPPYHPAAMIEDPEPDSSPPDFLYVFPDVHGNVQEYYPSIFGRNAPLYQAPDDTACQQYLAALNQMPPVVDVDATRTMIAAREFVNHTGNLLICACNGGRCNFIGCKGEVFLPSEAAISNMLLPYQCQLSGHIFPPIVVHAEKIIAEQRDPTPQDELDGFYCSECTIFQHAILTAKVIPVQQHRLGVCCLCNGTWLHDVSTDVTFGTGFFRPDPTRPSPTPGLFGIPVLGDWHPSDGGPPQPAVLKISGSRFDAVEYNYTTNEYVKQVTTGSIPRGLEKHRDRTLLYEAAIMQLAGASPDISQKYPIGLPRKILPDVHLSELFAFGLVPVSGAEPRYQRPPLIVQQRIPPRSPPHRLTHCIVVADGGEPMRNILSKYTYQSPTQQLPTSAAPVSVQNLAVCKLFSTVLTKSVRAQMHLLSRGMYHSDMHHGNIVYRGEGSNPAVSLIDFGRVVPVTTHVMPNTMPCIRWEERMIDCAVKAANISLYTRQIMHTARHNIMSKTSFIALCSRPAPAVWDTTNEVMLWSQCIQTYSIIEQSVYEIDAHISNKLRHNDLKRDLTVSPALIVKCVPRPTLDKLLRVKNPAITKEELDLIYLYPRYHAEQLTSLQFTNAQLAWNGAIMTNLRQEMDAMCALDRAPIYNGMCRIAAMLGAAIHTGYTLEEQLAAVGLKPDGSSITGNDRAMEGVIESGTHAAPIVISSRACAPRPTDTF